jgi:DNA-binding response OmpR family regulator
LHDANPVMTHRERILVVDDNATNRDILEARLTATGYEVLHAGDGEQAMAMALQHLPDLILLDIMMPKLNGIEVCRRLKADTSLPFTPIVLVTAKADSQDVVDGLEAGADEYLTKPIDQKVLVARVKALLRLKAMNDARRQPKARQESNCTDLFLSYSRPDRARIEALAAVLQRKGWTVWWDRHIKVGTSFDKMIEQALANAKGVVVAWSESSVNSDWVRAEASFALRNSKLLPLRLDNAGVPLRFTQIHSINFSAWDGSDAHPAFLTLAAEITELIGKSADK